MCLSVDSVEESDCLDTILDGFSDERASIAEATEKLREERLKRSMGSLSDGLHGTQFHSCAYIIY